MMERWQQENEEQHLVELLDVLWRVKHGKSGRKDALILAQELGILKYFLKETINEMER